MPETIAWEWVADGESNKSFEYRPGQRTGEAGAQYGNVDVYDQVAPMSSATLRATAVTTAQLLVILGVHRTPADQAGSNYVAEDPEGITFTGKISSVAWRRIVGSAYWEVEIKIPNPVMAGP